ncbi:hypothetical protein ABGB12_09765, partial [Actinocorallia sp. B10E7]|uniref:hypothetical protein n=1 Tax=Actinocorallia sp. B10E7 TaxID=3153558 RepID=UPI00325C8B1E
DLLLEVFRRRAEEGLAHQARALESDQPLWALWRFSTDPAGVALTMAFVGLVGRYESIRAEIADYSERFRVAQVEALNTIFDRYGIPSEEFPPVVLVVILTSISRVVMMEEALGFSTGHAETMEWVEQHIRKVEGPEAANAALRT